MNDLKTQNVLKIILTLITVLTVILVISRLTLAVGQLNSSKLINNKRTIVVKPTPTFIPAPEPVYKNWAIADLKTGEDIFSYPFSFTDVVLWGDYLFWADKFDLKSYNLKTHQVNEVVNNFYQQGKLELVRKSLKVVDNQLYFSTGGFGEFGNFYYLPTPEFKPMMFANKIRNGKIEYFNDRYWIVGGEGDGCGGETDYYVFNHENKQVKKVFTFATGCAKGDELIGFDKQNRAVMAYHTDEPNMVGYEYISIADLTRPNSKKTLLTAAQLKDTIYQIALDTSKQKLLMLGTKIYIFDLNTRKVESIGDLISKADQDAHLSVGADWQGNISCLYIDNEQGIKNVEVDFDKKIVTKDSSCNKAGTQSDADIEDAAHAEAFYQQLKLPAGYEFQLRRW